MPTVVLRHVTKRFMPGERREPTNLGRMVTSSARTLFDSPVSAYMEQMHSSPEPPDRDLALNNLSLTIRDGETMSILGPSGCGKTTLLKVIAGLIKPDEGEVLYDGTSIFDIPSMDRGIGMVFQNYALYPHMQAQDNIGFFDIVRRHPERIPARIRHIVEVMGVDIRYLLDRKPPTLSGGEQQRVAIARCLARDPKIFLFDEPLSNLDAQLRVFTRGQIKRLLDYYNLTSVYVTHDQTEAVSVADRIAIMRNGKIEQVGTYQNLYGTPVNAFVAQFFGTPPMNLFQGHVEGTTWYGHGQSLSISPIRSDLYDGDTLWVGIRPEHIEVAAEGVPATVEYVEAVYHDQHQIVYTNIDHQYKCVVIAPLEPEIEARSTIYLQFPADQLYLFDAKTGVRIG